MAYLGRLVRLGLFGLALLLGACSSLPPHEPLPPSHAPSTAEVASTRLARIAAASVPADAAGPSGFRLLLDGEHAFDARAVLAESAERTIDAQYFHVQDDSAGVAFLRSLRDAARRGVRVRLLVDDYHANEVFDLLTALHTEAHAEVRMFNPLLYRNGPPLTRLLRSWPEFERAHRRMHNKLFVADNAVAIFGGRNVADEYFMTHPVANFIDLDVIAVGPAVPALSDTFDLYWNSEHAWRVDRVPGAGRRTSYEQRLFERRVAEVPLAMWPPASDPLGQSAVRAQLEQGALQLRWGHASVHADPPSKVRDAPTTNQPTQAMRAKLDVIGRAREEVIIVNPYFLPGEVGMQMMAQAAQQSANGLVVRGLIFTNSVGSTDVRLAHRAYSHYRKDMLRLGMQLYELNPTQLQRSIDFGDFSTSTARLHVKAASVDGRWLLMGSVNLDGRSAIHNTELAVNIDCPALVADSLRALGGAPWRGFYRVSLAEGGQTLQWHAIDNSGRIELLAEEPFDSAWQRAVDGFKSMFVSEDLL